MIDSGRALISIKIRIRYSDIILRQTKIALLEKRIRLIINIKPRGPRISKIKSPSRKRKNSIETAVAISAKRLIILSGKYENEVIAKPAKAK